MQVNDRAKTEANTRLQFDALKGPGAAQAVYAAELDRRIQFLESMASDFAQMRRPSGEAMSLTPTAAASLGRLRSEGLTLTEKVEVLCRTLGQGPAAQTPAASVQAASTPVPVPARVPAPLSKLEEYERLQSAGEYRKAGEFYLANADAICAEAISRSRGGQAPKSKATAATGEFSKVEEYERLQSAGEYQEAGVFYTANADAICAQTIIRARKSAEELHETYRRK